MENALREPKSSLYNLEPGDIHLKETPDKIFYQLGTGRWARFYKTNKEARTFLRDSNYRGAIEFDFDSEALTRRGLEDCKYFLKKVKVMRGTERPVIWVKEDQNTSLSEILQQQLDYVLQESFEYARSNPTNEENAHDYNSLEETNLALTT